MSNHQRLSRRVARLWMGVNGLILVGLAAWILMPSTTAPPPEHRPEPAEQAAPEPEPDAEPAEPLPTKQDILAIRGVRFGISAPDVPWNSAQFDRLSGSAGAAPTMVQFFVNWTQDYPSETVELSYQRGMFPVISWEPWAGSAHGESQPEYALKKIIDGEFDDYIESFAQEVRRDDWPVSIRFAHEMNGYWYPWSEQRSGNSPGEFVEAWRHIHDIFQEVGATEVIWLWSPNIIRAIPDISMEALYPGDDYVDWAGMVGYSVAETTAAEVFDPTWEALREFTDKPLVITETGAQPGAHKVPWIEDFFTWLPTRADVIGFIWLEYDTTQGGNADWRFTETPEAVAAFQDGIGRTELAPPPVTDPPDS